MSDIIASFEIDKIGPKGDPGPGVVAGGTAGQVLAKIDSTDFNTHWIANNVTGSAGGVLSGTYPNPGFDSGALSTLGGASQTDLSALSTTVSNLTFASIGGQLTDAQLPSDLGLSDPGFDAVAIFTEGTGLITLGKVSNSRLATTPIGIIGTTWDGGGAAVTTGQAHGFITVPYAGTITGWSVSCDVLTSGTASFDVWRKTTGTTVPTSGDKITTTATLDTTTPHKRSTTATEFGAHTAVSVGDVFAFNYTTAGVTPTFITLEVEITKS